MSDEITIQQKPERDRARARSPNAPEKIVAPDDADGFWEFCVQQTRIIGALIVREIYTRFGRDNIGFAWLVVEPIMFCTAIILLWTQAVGHSSHLEISLVIFLLTGYMPLLMYRHCMMYTIRCMQANADLLYHRQITIFSMYFARLTVEIVGTFAAFTITCFFFFIWDIIPAPHDIGMVVGGFLLYAYISASIAILIGALSERSEVVHKIWGPISYIQVPLSGTFFMVYWLPSEARELIVYVPMVTAVEIIRGGYFGPSIPVYYYLPSALYFATATMVLGLYFLKDARAYVEIG
ncbi:ABC transporter permease [Desulfosediminicola sp.]|uniref:ABC transporter permease n=1 Tax=Desulfosediminicola sp. TaxID=2886825 RepID=UPI003AF29093